MKKRDSSEIKRRMEGRWLQAFQALAPSLTKAIEKLGKNVPCPVEGGVDGFRLFKDANYTGGGVKQSLRVFPEGIDMLMWVNGWSFVKTFDELEAWLGCKPVAAGPIYLPKPKSSIGDEDLRKWLNKIWMEAVPLSDDSAVSARAYFSSRWVNSAALSAKDIKYHPGLNYRDLDGTVLGKYGAVLCLVRDNMGVPVSIHRTFITKGGLKINLGIENKAKKLTPSINKESRGRSIRLFDPMQGFLGVSEGLETALAVFQVKGFPVWPALSNTMLRSFVPPKEVHTVINFVDKDRNRVGENTAETLRFNLEHRGIRVIDLLPPTSILDSDRKGVDWADQLKRDVKGFALIDQAIQFSQLKNA